MVLSRKPGEKVVLGEGITVTVLEADGNRVRIGIDAPDHVRILRGELACWLELDGDPASPPPAENGLAAESKGPTRRRQDRPLKR